jgi:tRNA nucleotidyltransferase (CCA-adding enzyme)
MKLYKVGGCVRDTLLHIKSKDIDYSVEASSYEEMREELLKRGCKIYLEKPEYLTIRGKLNGEDVDFVLCRKDGAYSDGRRPDDVTVGDIYDDLARRDFTVNAIAIDEDGNYLDPYNGISHLKDKILKCVGSNDRLKEDALRIVRAMRFSITKGFRLAGGLAEEISNLDTLNLLLNISSERIADELNKCLDFSLVETMLFLTEDYPTFGYRFLEILEEKKIRLTSKYLPN